MAERQLLILTFIVRDKYLIFVVLPLRWVWDQYTYKHVTKRGKHWINMGLVGVLA